MAYNVQDDICARRSRNRRNSRTAHDAHKTEHLSQRERVLAVVVAAGAYGATNHEIAARLRRLPHQVSPRLSELKALGLIFETGHNRQRRGFDPAAVHVAETFRTEWEREQAAECPPETERPLTRQRQRPGQPTTQSVDSRRWAKR